MNDTDSQIRSVIEKGFKFDKSSGITADHDVIVKSIICARVVCTKTIEIDEGAEVIGDIIANDVIVKGCVKGSIYARNMIKLCQNSKVCGKVYYGDIEIEKNAILTGFSEKMAAGKLDKYFKDAKTTVVAKPAK